MTVAWEQKEGACAEGPYRLGSGPGIYLPKLPDYTPRPQGGRCNWLGDRKLSPVTRGGHRGPQTLPTPCKAGLTQATGGSARVSPRERKQREGRHLSFSPGHSLERLPPSRTGPPEGTRGLSQAARQTKKQEQGLHPARVLGLLTGQLSTGSVVPRSLQFPGLGPPRGCWCASHMPHMVRDWAHSLQGGQAVPSPPWASTVGPSHQLEASGAPAKVSGAKTPHASSLPGAQHLWHSPIQLPGSLHLFPHL